VPTGFRRTDQSRYPREFLLAELRRVGKELGRIPTMSEFRRLSRVSPTTLEKRFDGWNGALASAGFDPAKSRLSYDDMELVEELRRVALLLGETPYSTKFSEVSQFSATTITRRVGHGSWERACLAAGLPPPKRPVVRLQAGWNKGLRKLRIPPDELRYLYETEGLSAEAIGVRLGVAGSTVGRMLRQHGIPVRRLTYSMPKETTIETLMYVELERRGVTFVRQQVVDGVWVVDAMVPGPKIVIECDGEYWHGKPEMKARDARKDGYLKSRGYTVLRFPEAAIRADVGQCVDRVVKTLVDYYNHPESRSKQNRSG
jgi:very-short-patch-repair endonuclease